MTTKHPEDDSPPGRTRRLHRSSTDRYLGGVAGGLAERLAVDPALVRLGLVAVTLYLGFRDSGEHLLVLAPYTVAWLFLPSDTRPAIVARLGRRDARREVLLIAVVIAAAFLLGSFSSFVVLALGGIGVALLRDRPTPDGTAASDPDDTGLSTLIPGHSGARVPKPRREPALWPITLGLVVVITVISIAVDRALADGIDPRVAIDLALLAVGAVLVLSAWRGRARVTLLALVALAPLWAATSVPDIGRFPGEGTVSARPTSLAEASREDGLPILEYEIGYGTIDVDLTDLPADDTDIEVRVSLTVGRALVTVPADARVKIDGTIGLGGMSVEAPQHWKSDRDPALNRHIGRTYPPLGKECSSSIVPDQDLVSMALEAGIIDRNAEVPSMPDVIDAIGEGGYPRPEFEFEEENWVEPEYDEFGNPVATTITPQTPPDMSYWLVSVDTSYLQYLCRPEPPPALPATIVIKPTIGLGSLEIQRV